MQTDLETCAWYIKDQPDYSTRFAHGISRYQCLSNSKCQPGEVQHFSKGPNYDSQFSIVPKTR